METRRIVHSKWVRRNMLAGLESFEGNHRNHFGNQARNTDKTRDNPTLSKCCPNILIFLILSKYNI